MLENKELLEITGGGIDWSIAGLVGAAITFITGIIDGFLRPVKCE